MVGWERTMNSKTQDPRLDQIRSDQIRSDQVRSGQVRSDQTRSGQIRSYLACMVSPTIACSSMVIIIDSLDVTLPYLTQELLRQCEASLKQAASQAVARIFAAVVIQPRIAHAQVKQAAATAEKAAATMIGEAMLACRQFADAQQKGINRSLLPQIQERMRGGYEAGRGSVRGDGVFSRIKSAVNTHAQSSMSVMFNDATAELLGQVRSLIDALREKVVAIHATITEKVGQLYSVCWQSCDQEDAEAYRLTRAARDSAIHRIRPLREKLDEAMAFAGIARTAPDVEMTDVQGPQERFEAAQQAGLVHDLTQDEVQQTEKRKHDEPSVKSEKRPKPSSSAAAPGR